MKVTKVAFEKTIGMPNYSNDRPIVVECILEGDETKEQAWSKINQDMIAWHRQEYPHLYQESKTAAPADIQTERPKDTLAALIADIYSCKDLKVLEGYRLLAKTKPELQAAYDQMTEKLSK